MQGRAGDAVGRRRGNVVKMRRSAANQGAETNDRVTVESAVHQFARHQRHLECPWHAVDGDGIVAGAVTNQGIHGTIEQAFGDDFVEAANDIVRIQPRRTGGLTISGTGDFLLVGCHTQARGGLPPLQGLSNFRVVHGVEERGQFSYLCAQLLACACWAH